MVKMEYNRVSQIMGTDGLILNELMPQAVQTVLANLQALSQTELSDINQLFSNLSAAQSSIGSLQTQLEGLNLSQIQTNLGNLTSQVASLQTALNALQTTQTGQQNSITALSASLTQLQSVLTSIQTQQTSDETNITALQSGLSAVQAKQTTDENNITALNAGLTSLQTAFAKRVSLNGPLTVSIGSNNVYTITDFDSNETYSVSASAGAVYLSGDDIIFTAPSTAGPVTLTVNLNQYVISVVSQTIQTPTIVSPTNASIGLFMPITLKATTYQYFGSPTYPQASATWQIATNSTFSTIAYQSVGDPANLDSITVSSLNNNTVYFARVLYTSKNGVSSSYSNTVSFTTPATSYPKAITASLIFTSALDKAGNNYYASSLSVNANGTLAAVGNQISTQSNNLSHYKVGICEFASGVWKLKYTIAAPVNITNQAFGSNVKISYDGTFLLTSDWAIGVGNFYIYTLSPTAATLKTTIIPTGTNMASEFNSINILLSSNQQKFIVGSYLSNNGDGRILVYTYNTSSNQWNTSADQIITPPSTLVGSGSNFGYSLAGNIDLSVIAVSAPLYNNSAGCVVVYKLISGAYSQIAILTDSNNVSGDLFGQSKIAMSSDGTYLAIGAPGVNTSTGKVYLYTNTNGVYTQTQVIQGSDSVTNDQFGLSLEFSSNDGYLYVGAPYNMYNGNTSAGAVYIFQNASGTFNQVSKIINSGSSAYFNLGYNMSMSQNGNTLLAAAPGNNYGMFSAIN